MVQAPPIRKRHMLATPLKIRATLVAVAAVIVFAFAASAALACSGTTSVAK